MDQSSDGSKGTSDDGASLVAAERTSESPEQAGQSQWWTGNIPFVLARSALLSGLCHFVPIPLLDDFLERRCRGFMISALLKREGRSYPLKHVDPLYLGAEGWFSGCLGWFLWLPLKIIVKLLKKIFKSILVVLLVREAALAVGETLLLGHCFHRALLRDEFKDREGDPEGSALTEEALLFRAAFEEAFDGSDRRLLVSLLSTIFSQIKSLPRAGSHAVRAMFGRGRKIGDEPGQVPEADRSIVDQGVDHLRRTMEQDQLLSFVGDFETRLGKALERERKRALAQASSEG